MPLDLVHAEDDIHSNDSHQQQALHATWYDTEARAKESQIAIMPFPEERRIDEMLLEVPKCVIWLSEVSLGIVVQTS